MLRALSYLYINVPIRLFYVKDNINTDKNFFCKQGSVLLLQLHECFVVSELHLLPINKAVPLGPGLVSVVWVLQHVQSEQLGLLFVVSTYIIDTFRYKALDICR